MVVAPFNLSGGRVEPYVSLDEVKFSPTASSLDFTNLLENGSQTAQDRALSDLIVRASAKADSYTMGLFGTLNATSNTENGRYRTNRHGQLVVHPSFSPILEITAFSAGWGPGTSMQTVTLTANNCSIERDQFLITSNAANGLTQFGFSGLFGGAWNRDSQVFCQWTYVNGWANTFTTTTTAIGATTINVLDPTGVYPSQFLTIWDGQNDEYVQVSSSYTAGSTAVLLTNPTIYKHGSGVNISALPATVKQAVIHFIVAMVKQRGQGGLVLSEIGEPTAVTGKSETSMEDEILGYDLLDAFKSMWGRS